MKKVAELHVSITDVVNMMRISGQFEGPLNEAVTRKLTADSARKYGLTGSTDELQNAVDQFRLSKGLQKKQVAQNWFKARHLSLDDLESHLETDLLIDKFKTALEKSAVKEKYSAYPQVQVAIREVIYREWLAEQFRHAKQQPALNLTNPR